MNKSYLYTLISLLLLWHPTYAQRTCGIQALKAAMIARDPSWADRFEAQRAGLQGIADNYKLHKHTAAKTTGAHDTIPLIFHVVIDSVQLAQIGGIAGLQQRIDSQIAVLNRDYNRLNLDSVLIPYGWKHLYASAGIHFGLAHTRPDGYATPGYELKIIPNGGFNGVFTSYSDAKHSTLGPGSSSISPGLNAWDNTKYINIWCVNFSDYPGLLGVTVAPSFTTGPSPDPVSEIGVCLNYQALGKRASPTDNYIATGYGSDYYDLGRTLTHELGHMFEIWHTWGDDGGRCPWTGGKDDGIADTPPEADSKVFNFPDTIPGGTFYDVCRYDGAVDTQLALYGVASLDFMNYTDDIGMLLFTTDQAAAMAAQVTPGGESYSLTQHPELLAWPPGAGVTQIAADNSLNISPNPTTGTLSITFDHGSDELQEITITNILGLQVGTLNTKGTQKDYYSIDLSGMNKGIYFVRCNFASGSITRKILLQ